MKRFGFRFIRAVFSPSIRFFWPTKVLGKENYFDNKRALLVSNHLSNLDPIGIGIRIMKRDYHAIGKEEVMSSSFAKKFFTSMGIIPIKRGEADLNAVREVLKLLNSDRQVLIFPEGTRNKESVKNLLPFKAGVGMFAIKTKSPIIPMILYSKHKLFKKNYILIGKPIYPSEFTSGASAKDDITEALKLQMKKMRIAIDAYVENKDKSAIKEFCGN